MRRSKYGGVEVFISTVRSGGSVGREAKWGERGPVAADTWSARSEVEAKFLEHLVYTYNGLLTIFFSKSLELGISWSIGEEAVGAKYRTDSKVTSAKV